MTTNEDHWQTIRDVMAPINNKIFELLGDQVVTGPFAGMRVIPNPVWDDGNSGAKLIGSYEFELHKAVRKAISRKPDAVINVGCAEGFYAVGLARRLPDAMVFAMDIDDGSLDQCEENAERNGRKVQTVTGRPGPQDLIRPGYQRTLYFLDCEGDESELLNKDDCPQLINSDIIVECHDFFYPKIKSHISSSLISRFSDTHDIERIVPQIPNPADYPFLRSLPLGFQLLAITEKRPSDMAWLACWARRR